MNGDPKHIFIGGLHRSGTSLLARLLAAHPSISAFGETGVPEDEGQHLQSVYLPAEAHGGMGRFSFDPRAHLTEDSSLVSAENRAGLLSEWEAHWDLSKAYLLEKSPPNLIRMRFLQAMFPSAHFLVIIRHPIPVSLATRRYMPSWESRLRRMVRQGNPVLAWYRSRLPRLIKHWLVAHRTFSADAPYIRNLVEVRYEELVANPTEVVHSLHERLGLDQVRIEYGVVNRTGNDVYLDRWRMQLDDRFWGPYPRWLARKFESELRPFDYSLLPPFVNPT